MSARSTSASSCASCWVRKRRGSGKTASLSWFCSFISCLHAERTPIASAEAKSRYPARNPSQEYRHAAGHAKNQLLPPRAAKNFARTEPCSGGVEARPGGPDSYKKISPGGRHKIKNGVLRENHTSYRITFAT